MSNWSKRYAAESCSCHGWPKLQCPNTTEAEKHIISELSRQEGPSIGQEHSRSKEVADWILGED